MRSVFPLLRFTVTTWLIAGGALTGCAQHRIPAIDPTGAGLFSGTTTLEPPGWLHGGLFHHRSEPQPVVAPVAIPVLPITPSCTPPIAIVPAPQPLVAVPLPSPAVAPLTPPACERPPARPLVQPCSQDGLGPELKVTPARIVAPVGTEVVVVAGICAPHGYYVMRQPLEWMLAQDGVGQIVAIGHESPHNASYLLRHSPQKLATNYARAHTSTISQVLDRGTPSPADDVYLQKGQSWITVSSPTEGTSHVVVWAPKEHNWERRKATATIHWVDAAWRFPPPVTARAGARQALTTLVTRSGGPAMGGLAGWIVRYEVLDGPPAAFSTRGNTAVEVITDAAGRATAELLPQSVEPGITTIRVQIIRPAAARADTPQMVVGQGLTSVQWTTPGLAARAIGSSSVTADGAIAYHVEVTNSGDLPTRGVVLSYTPPPGVTILNSTPAAQLFGQRYEWRLGDLAPRTAGVVELNCRAAVTASIRSCFRATSAEQLTAEACATTDVRTNALSVKMTGPETVEVGREARFLVDVTNVGESAVTNVTASDTFDPGLSHSGGEPSPIVRTLVPSLAPGQTHRFGLTFIVTQPGRQCHRLDVTADGGHVAAARACVTGTQPVAAPPQLSVRVTGPPRQQAGQIAEYLVHVQNAGGSPVSNVLLTVSWGINLELQQATRDHEDDLARRSTRWRIGQLAAGQSVTRQLNCLCLNPDQQGAFVRATATSQQTPAVSAQSATVITPGPAAPPPQFPTPDSRPPNPVSPADEGLKVSVGSLANPIQVGATTTFVVNVANGRNATDRDVAITVQVVGDGLAISRMGGPTAVLRSAANSAEFGPVREVRASEQLPPYRIEVRAIKPGQQKLRVTVTSSGVPAGVIAEGEVTVNPQ